MHRLQLHYTLGAQAQDAQVRNPLIDLLRSVDQHGSISAAARALGLSYRHVWGELKRWEQTLGHELLVWEKGQRAVLSPFGAKLMWAERQAQARLAPQIEALRAELERSFAQAFDDTVQVVTLYASHDEALSALREHVLQASQPLHLDVRFTGSLDAIRALNEGRCEMAGFHTLLDTAAQSHTRRSYKPLLQPGRHKIIGFARRYQGLMLAPGNPLGLFTLQDVASKRARFANRALGSGTRVLLDELLDRQRLTGSQLVGFESAEASHAAVAQRVASGECDAGIGLESAARAAGLDFVPLAQERYHLVCLKSTLQRPATQTLLARLQDAAWQRTLSQVAGHAPADCGKVLSLKQMLPWWEYRQPKGH
ncbi:substrate-binding domain-containing protein [Curvibacter sp. APW13]|uniref:substrate-binding domain-containing protein n=1 Tax=Curvibacter sp. APW13 TaxID=3077236 RepID=UPI0028DF4B66|nr:substrate-binding domain-containing protein [Curvibacter sp. APW13]MDT8990695.1 substrate-binding domain-containing protein [Curvibacter sp. APW13]